MDAVFGQFIVIAITIPGFGMSFLQLPVQSIQFLTESGNVFICIKKSKRTTVKIGIATSDETAISATSCDFFLRKIVQKTLQGIC